MDSLLRRFLALHWAVVLLLTVVFVCLGAFGQWLYVRAGIDLQAMLIARSQGAWPEPGLGRVMALAVVLGLVGVPASAVVAHGILRLVARTTEPFALAYRVCAFSTIGALGKLAPFIGYFVAIAAIFWISVRAVRRVYKLSTARSVMVVALSSVATTSLMLVVILSIR